MEEKCFTRKLRCLEPDFFESLMTKTSQVNPETASLTEQMATETSVANAYKEFLIEFANDPE